MRSIERTGKTIEDAVNSALEELSLTRDEVEVEVLEEPSKGFLGLLGVRDALVRIDEIFNPEKEVREYLGKIFEIFRLDPFIDIKLEDEIIRVDITGREMGILIGRRGDTLDSLQFLLNLIINKKSDKRIKVYLDIEGYRLKREKTLERLAQRLAEKVKKTGRKVVLEPMNPHERRTIHMALQDDQEITTYSEGEEPYRKIVIVQKH